MFKRKNWVQDHGADGGDSSSSEDSGVPLVLLGLPFKCWQAPVTLSSASHTQNVEHLVVGAQSLAVRGA